MCAYGLFYSADNKRERVVLNCKMTSAKGMGRDMEVVVTYLKYFGFRLDEQR